MATRILPLLIVLTLTHSCLAHIDPSDLTDLAGRHYTPREITALGYFPFARAFQGRTQEAAQIYKEVVSEDNNRRLAAMPKVKRRKVEIVDRRIRAVENAVIEICHEEGMSMHYEMIADIDGSHDDFVRKLILDHPIDADTPSLYSSTTALWHAAKQIGSVAFDSGGTPHEHRLNLAHLRMALRNIRRLRMPKSFEARVAARVEYLNGFLASITK